MAAVAIRTEHLSVSYKVRTERQVSFGDLALSGFRRRLTTTVEGLINVTLDIHVGEVVGLVGRNGAGKSTLLTAIAGLLPPTSGTILARSQPSLLGVGAALIPTLSGHRNITIGALAMGLQTEEIEHVRAFVEDFTELGPALDRPLRTYSSGMRARLAFALATYTMPEIMLIDEALAVGDKTFRAKSLARVREMQARAGTVVMATHNMGEIRRTCSRAIWLDQGRVVMDGKVKKVLTAYNADGDDD